jgi:hypothetical protein
MTKALLLTAVLMLAPLPAASQSDDRDRDPRRGRDIVEELLRDIGHGGPESRRGASFLLRSGDATVAVRCDPQDSMRACVDATVTLLDRARTLVPSGGAGTPPGGTPPSR